MKILVIQTAKIGDLVCTTPVFREIKNKFPNCYLAALVIAETKDILRNNPRLDEIISLNDFPEIIGKIKLIRKLRKEKYDWVFTLLPDSFNNLIAFWSSVPNRVATTYKDAGELASLTSVFNNYRLEYREHTLALRHYLNLLKFAGIENYSEEKEIFIKPEEEERALNFLKKQNLDNDDLLIGISVGTRVRLKEWELPKFAELSDRLIEQLGAKIIFIGASGDMVKIEETQKMIKNPAINAVGVFELHELPALLKKLKLFVSVDTGPLYIANTVGTPVIDIAGPIDIKEVRPSGNKFRILQKDIYCVPCSFMFKILLSCKEGHRRCLKEISPEEVFNAAVSLISSKD